MKRSTSVVSLALGSIALIAALAPAPQEVVKAKVGHLKELADARVKVCERMLDHCRELLNSPPAPGAGKEPAEEYWDRHEAIELWSRRLLDAKLDAAKGIDDRIAILATEVERINKFLPELKRLGRTDGQWQIVAYKMEFYLLEDEYRLEKEKAGR